MTLTRTISDPGVRGCLSDYSNADLMSALGCATTTREQVQVFIEAIEAELAERSDAPEPPAA